MTKLVGVHEAKTQFSRLLVEVGRGEEIVITSRGKPVARLVGPPPRGRILGSDRDVLVIPDDFDAPLPSELLAAFEA